MCVNDTGNNPLWHGAKLKVGETYTLRAYETPCSCGKCGDTTFGVLVEEHHNPLPPLLAFVVRTDHGEYVYDLENFDLVVENKLPEETTTFLTNPNSPIKEDQFDKTPEKAEFADLVDLRGIIQNWKPL